VSHPVQGMTLSQPLRLGIRTTPWAMVGHGVVIFLAPVQYSTLKGNHLAAWGIHFGELDRHRRRCRLWCSSARHAMA
jgi:hypothetical protein